MNIEERLKLIQRQNLLGRWFPYGCDKTMAAVILYELCIDPYILPFTLEELDIDETGYNHVLSNLSFNVHSLTEEEKDILFDFCLYFFRDRLK